jgi:hypothetical protein
MTPMNLNTTRGTTARWLSCEAASRRPLDRCGKGMLDRLASVQFHTIRDGIQKRAVMAFHGLRFAERSVKVWCSSSQTKQRGTSDEGAEQVSYGKRVVVVALALFFCVLIKNAWLSDDAYITLRTVSNFIHGYGLTWNADERVQTYTHPLWILLLSGTYFCVRSIYFSSLLLSLGVSAIAITLFAFRLVKSPLVAVVGLTILAASKSFVDSPLLAWRTRSPTC